MKSDRTDFFLSFPPFLNVISIFVVYFIFLRGSGASAHAARIGCPHCGYMRRVHIFPAPASFFPSFFFFPPSNFLSSSGESREQTDSPSCPAPPHASQCLPTPKPSESDRLREAIPFIPFAPNACCRQCTAEARRHTSAAPQQDTAGRGGLRLFYQRPLGAHYVLAWSTTIFRRWLLSRREGNMRHHAFCTLYENFLLNAWGAVYFRP